MLQSNMRQNHSARAPLDGGPQAEENGVGELVGLALGFLRRQYLVIIFTAALALAASVIYLRITPPTYTAQVKVLFEGSQKTPFFQQQSVVADAPLDSSQLELQIQLVTSRAIATSVI